MKKLVVIVVVALFSFNVNAQQDNSSQIESQTSQGKWLVEVGTSVSGANAGSLIPSIANTGFSFVSIDGDNYWNVGVEGGYFVADNLAVKAGLGYGDGSFYDGFFSYKVGAKYYIIGKIPLTIDLNGGSGNSYTPMYVAAQAGYAWFLGQNLSVEPGLRYNYGFNDDAGDGEYNPLSLNIGFVFHF